MSHSERFYCRQNILRFSWDSDMSLAKVNPNNFSQTYEFSVTLGYKSNGLKKCQPSSAIFVKPLIYFASLFGMQMLRYSKDQILSIKLRGKLYCLVIISLILTSTILVRPGSWRDTKSDIPLNILTKVFGIVTAFEITYIVFVVCFGNSKFYVKLMKKCDDIDSHIGFSEKNALKLRILSSVLIIIPVLLVSFTVWLRKFNIVNIGVHFVYFMLILQGTIIFFFILQIYAKMLILHELIIKKIKNMPPSKALIFGESTFITFIRNLFTDPEMLQRKLDSHYCWLELMQIYDKVADCIFYFNKIYAGQVFLMFNVWFLCTLLAICRSLSPSVRYREVFLNDLFMYSTLNARPIFLSIMCQLLMRGRKNILSMLVYSLVNDDEPQYMDQVQTMMDLVNTRKIEVSANVYTADLSTVIEFGGRSISFIVLMIQYFYNHDFSK